MFDDNFENRGLCFVWNFKQNFFQFLNVVLKTINVMLKLKNGGFTSVNGNLANYLINVDYG